MRFDGGPAMLELRKLELATGLSIFYTLNVPGRFDRFATRVLGPDAEQGRSQQAQAGAERASAISCKGQIEITDKTLKAKGQKDTEEGYGRLDALNRIGNQVFYTDLAASGLSGLRKQPARQRRARQLPADLDRAVVAGGRNTTPRSSSR